MAEPSPSNRRRVFSDVRLYWAASSLITKGIRGQRGVAAKGGVKIMLIAEAAGGGNGAQRFIAVRQQVFGSGHAANGQQEMTVCSWRLEKEWRK